MLWRTNAPAWNTSERPLPAPCAAAARRGGPATPPRAAEAWVHGRSALGSPDRQAPRRRRPGPLAPHGTPGPLTPARLPPHGLDKEARKRVMDRSMEQEIVL